MEPLKVALSPAAYRRRRQIENCLYENLQRMPYSSISVSDLCRQVGISRKAYYKYYRDKEDCLSAVLDHFLHSAMLRTATMPDGDPMAQYREQLEYWRENRAVLDIVVQNNLLQKVIQRGILQVSSEDRSILEGLNRPECPCDEDILASFLGSQMMMILQWYRRDFQDPLEEMAQKLYRISHFAMIEQKD